MKKEAYKTLSKLLRQQLREKRVAVTEIRAQADALNKTMRSLEEHLIQEQAFTKKNPHFRYLFETFRKDLSHKQIQLAQQRCLLDLQLREFQEHLNQLFSEMKSYEIPYARFQKAAKTQEEALEQKRLDETGQSIFRAKGKKAPFTPWP